MRCTSARSAWSARAPAPPRAALWTTLRALPLRRDGIGRHLAARAAALDLAAALDADPRTAVLVDPELDIVCCLPAGGSPPAAPDRAFAPLAADGWHVAKLRVRADCCASTTPMSKADQPTTTVLR